MLVDLRETAAPYYDLNPTIPEDVAFYRALLPSADAVVLELGCGTGRVLRPLAESCGFIHGIDASEAMLAICRQKLDAAVIPPTKAQVAVGDITNFHLGRTFDLIIAPYRVFQLLDTDTQVDGLFRCVRAHLASGGTCILNAVHPGQDPERLRGEWCTQAELPRWEVTVVDGHEVLGRVEADDRALGFEAFALVRGRDHCLGKESRGSFGKGHKHDLADGDRRGDTERHEIQPAAGHRADTPLTASPLAEIQDVSCRYRQDAKRQEEVLRAHGRGHKGATPQPKDDNGERQ
jgi:SAM-dependent methyltransferase